MNKCVPFLHALKDMDSRFRGNDSRGNAGMTAESRFSLSVIPVKTGIQDVVGAAHYSILQLAHKIVNFLKPHGVKSIAIFGSYARGDFSIKSDIDILVEFSAAKTLYDIVGIEQDLSDALGIKVDLLTEFAISPYLIDSIKKSLVKIY